MSLIHDALKSMDAPSSASAPLSAPRSTTSAARPGWIGGVVAFASVLGAAGVGWMWWQNQTSIHHLNAQALPDAAQTAPAPATRAVVVPPLPIATDPVVAADAVAVPTTVPLTATPAASMAVVAPTSGLQTKTTPTASLAIATPPAATAGSVRPASAEQTLASAHRTQKAVANKETVTADEVPVELRFARFVSAMKTGQHEEAERELLALKKYLPPEALGLVRAQAWFDLQAGRYAAAAEAYRSILDRMPGDEESAINLATIQLRQQHTEEARATLDTALRLQPDSAALRSALGHFHSADTRYDK